MVKKKYYAVARGRVTAGIYRKPYDSRRQTDGFHNSMSRGFSVVATLHSIFEKTVIRALEPLFLSTRTIRTTLSISQMTIAMMIMTMTIMKSLTL